jgi:UDP-galactopyranose mutase
VKRALIIGGGFAGCAAAHQLHLMGGWDVTIVESSSALGAGVRTQWWGGHPHTFGPRHFLTQNEKVWAYMDALVSLRKIPEHEFYTYVERDNAFYSYPINTSDIPAMPDRDKVEEELRARREPYISNEFRIVQNLEDYWINSVGPTLYSKMVEGYNKKMWAVDDNRQIDEFGWSPKGVALKSGPRAAWDNALSGYPYAANGYDDYFAIATQSAKVLLTTRAVCYSLQKREFTLSETGGTVYQFDLVVNTIAPDDFLSGGFIGNGFGSLPFMGRDFHCIVLPVEQALPKNTYMLYYANSEQFTRVVEYKKFTRHQSPTTLLGLEIPSRNGKHYPMPFKAEQRRAAAYHAMMPPGVYSIGRAGSYRYGLDMDDCIEQAMVIREELEQGGQEHAVPIAKWRKIDA